MTLYVTPFGRRLRRRAYNQPFQNEEWEQPECDVLVPINVRAEADAYTIKALLPGVRSEDLDIQVVNETITLKGEIGQLEADEGSDLVRECPMGKFYRVIRLPEALDANKASADLSDGVLTLRVPKAEENRPRSIKVNKN
jgi:HSP20 family protein